MSEIKITDKIITYEGSTWQVNNITNVEKYIFTPKAPFSTRSIALAIALAFIGLVFLSDGPGVFSILAVLGGGGFAYYAFRKNREPRDFWGVWLETSAGRGRLFTSSKEQDIDNVIMSIQAAMSSSDPVNQVWHLHNETITHHNLSIKDSSIHESFNVRPA